MNSHQGREGNGAAPDPSGGDPDFTGACERFRVRGFDDEVSGVRYTGLTPPVRGMPLGGVATGFVSLEGDGTLGESTMFNSLTPRRQINQPLFGLVVDGTPVTLTSTALPGLAAAQVQQYFGHYPMVDVAYALDGPVQAEVCAWAPVLPGDLATSNTPAVFFRLTLTNTADREVPVRAAINFAGPTGSESGAHGDAPRRDRRRRARPARRGAAGAAEGPVRAAQRRLVHPLAARATTTRRSPPAPGWAPRTGARWPTGSRRPRSTAWAPRSPSTACSSPTARRS